MRQHIIIVVGTYNVGGEFIALGSFGPFEDSKDSDQARNFSARVRESLPEAIIQYVEHVDADDLDSFVREVIESGDLEPITGSGAARRES